MLWIADERDARIVELDIARAGIDQGAQLRPIGGDQTGPEALAIVLIEPELAAGVVVHAVRRWKRNLGHAARRAFEEFECTHHRARLPADRPDDVEIREALRRPGGIAPLELRRAGAIGGEALPAEDQLEPPAAPAEFAIGERLQAEPLLQCDDVADAFIFHRAQLSARMRAQRARRRLRPEILLARALQPLRPQQAADMISAERRPHRAADSNSASPGRRRCLSHRERACADPASPRRMRSRTSNTGACTRRARTAIERSIAARSVQ